MKRISGIFSGTGAALNIGLGFKPDWVRLLNVAASDMASIDWHRRYAVKTTCPEGIKRFVTTGTDAALTVGTGIVPYAGGTKQTSVNTAYVVHASISATVNDDLKGTIATWTLDTTANRTGHFSAALDTTYCGVGSVVEIQLSSGIIVFATIVALTNSGSAADEVTFDRAITSGDVLRIFSKTDFITAPIGTVLGAGITINETADVNVSGELVLLEAGVDDTSR